MGARKEIFVTGGYYHIYNRAVAGIPIFSDDKAAKQFLNCAQYYCLQKPPTKYSVYRRNEERFSLQDSNKIITLCSYCIMPNHFHFLLRQDVDEGIRKFIMKLTNSFAHYYSTKNNFSGHIFQGNFRAVNIENDEQLLHVSRYIHLNPTTSNLVKNPEEYNYSSFQIYLGIRQSQLINTSVILELAGSLQRYKKFVIEQKGYQKKLRILKHLTLE